MVLSFKVGEKTFGRQGLFLLAGPCVLQESQIGYDIACAVDEITRKLGIPYIFKASYSKANRTSKDSYRGPGLERGLEQMARIREDLNIPVMSDVHTQEEAKAAALVLDVLQIPAFLCRQTYLIESAARSGKAVNLKKGQFMAPGDMKYAVEKVSGEGNERVFVTERGSCFGYNNLVVDMRAFHIMKDMNCLRVFDGTHSTQLPGAGKGETSGQREMIPCLVKAAVAAGCDGLFLEVHPRPEESPSDRASIFPLSRLSGLLEQALEIRGADRDRMGL